MVRQIRERIQILWIMVILENSFIATSHSAACMRRLDQWKHHDLSDGQNARFIHYSAPYHNMVLQIYQEKEGIFILFTGKIDK